MIRVRQQLKAYHKTQGLTGKRLKQAVWADVGLVKANTDVSICAMDSIGALFGFHRSPQGQEYWGRRAYPHMYRGRR